jgi:hypothetical protein
MTFEEDDQSLLLQDLDNRTAAFRRNPELDILLKELAERLKPVGQMSEAQFDKPKQPPLFLVGAPRSGTSVFIQYLSLSGGFTVPTNLLSRFYYAPYVGGLIQEMLTNPRYNYKNELAGIESAFTMTSQLGKAEGMLAPNEFFHFWRRFLPRYDPQYLSPKDQTEVDHAGLRRGIASIEAVFGKPFASKAIMLQYNLDLLLKTCDPCLIIYIKREPKWILQSILLAREAFYGDREKWWSVKPEEFEQLKTQDAYRQIAGQVYKTQQRISQQLAEIPAKYQLIIDYESFCRQPQDVLAKIAQKYSELGCKINPEHPDHIEFKVSQKLSIPQKDMDLLCQAYRDFENEG